MEKYVDLHMHTTVSDGIYTREELIKKAKDKNLVAISITDHDTIDAYEDFDLKIKG